MMRKLLQTSDPEDRAMFDFLEKYFAYRRLKPVVAVLPMQLAKSFGSARHYTLPQARRAIADLKMSTRAAPSALAAACTLQELETGGAGVSAEDYRRLRSELAELFSLARADFTMENLQSRQFNAHHPAPENVYATGGHP
ncbi:MAG TPA: DUF6559 family protein [Hyphomicrobiaceae bacterium]|nr:DUF6559 family protein [Hyphomicrobiaceae bacterium]